MRSLVDFCHRWCKRSPLKTVWKLVAMQQMSLSKGQAAHIQRSPISSRLISPIRASYSVLYCTGVDFSVRSPKHNFMCVLLNPCILVEEFFFFFPSHQCCIAWGSSPQSWRAILGLIHQAIFLPHNEKWWTRFGSDESVVYEVRFGHLCYLYKPSLSLVIVFHPAILLIILNRIR
jgi:hypothetical protein